MKPSVLGIWQSCDSAVLAAFGAVMVLYGLLGVLGYIPLRESGKRGLTKLREQAPVFRDMTEEEIHRLQSWCMLVVGFHVLVAGIVLLVTIP